MSIEERLFAALAPLFDGRVFPDMAPAGTGKPYCTYQQVGGQPVNFMEAAVPEKRNARMQINVWGESRIESMRLMRAVENVAVAQPLLGYVESAAVATFDESSELRGARQDFSFWFIP